MKKRIGALLLAVVLVLGLCACSMSDKVFVKEGIHVVVILGNHANANHFHESMISEKLHGLLVDALSYYKDGEDYVAKLNVSVIISDGKPTRELLMEEYINRKDEVVIQELLLIDDATYAEKAISEGEDIVERVEEALLSDNLRAKDEGVDLLAAISEAARILRSEPGAENHIFIYDTGVVTEGKMAMGTDADQLDIQKGEVDDVLNKLGESAMPNLENIKVHFYGLGDVCVGQKDMREFGDEEFQSRFVEFWTKFFERCGVTKENLNQGKPLTYSAIGLEGSAMLWDYEGDEENKDQYYPKVRNVPFYEIVRETENNDEEDGQGGSEEKEVTPINLSASELGGFYGDYEGQDPGKFKNPDQAIAALKSYEEYALKQIRENPELKLYVIGSRAMTSSGDDMKDDKASKARAISVSKLLQEQFGIPAEQIVEIDAGVQRFSWSSKKQEFTKGKGPDKTAQAEHRVVTLIPATENNMERIAELEGEQDLCP